MIHLTFGSFQFPCNPSALQILSQNDIKELPRPHFGAVSQNYGRLCRMVRGEGVFSGENAFLQFIRLRETSGGAALLTVPGFEPFYAFLKKLEYLGAPGQDFVRYAFEFVENPSMAYSRPAAPPQHIAAEGQTVFDIAELYGLSAEYILSRNPALQSLRLSEGEVVLL